MPRVGSQTFQALGIEPFRIAKTVPTEALKALLALHGEIDRLKDERAATPEEARRANVELRHLMRSQDNYFEDLEEHASRILTAVGHPGGPLTQRTASEIAAYLGFTLHYAPDLPQTTRSVAESSNKKSITQRNTFQVNPGRGALAGATSTCMPRSPESTGYCAPTAWARGS